MLTVDVPLIRLAEGDAWPILLVRSATTFVAAIVIWAVWRAFSANVPSLAPGRTGLIVAALYGSTSIFFLLGVYHTSTANLVFILAFNAVFAMLLSWFFLGERPRPVTLVTMAVMLVGVLIIVVDGIEAGNLFGDLMALCAAFFVAVALTITRGSGKDMGFTSLTGVLLPFVVAVVMTLETGYRIDVPWWIILNGAVVTPLSFYFLATGPRWISAPEVAMFYLLETCLAPIWVWLIFEEVPTTNALIGGLILIVALVFHSLWQLWDGTRRRAVTLPQRAG